jgi:DNA-directed RNA polymerase alpha subunit
MNDDTDIRKSGLCIRTANALCRAGIFTVGACRSLDAEKLANIDGIGYILSREVEKVIGIKQKSERSA